MIAKNPFILNTSRPYAYEGKPHTCKWCGLKLSKLWFYQDYEIVGEQLKKGKLSPNPMTRPVWRRRQDADIDRGRGFAIAIYGSGGPTTPIGNGHFCTLSCAVMFALCAASGGYSFPPVDEPARRIRKRSYANGWYKVKKHRST